MTKQEKTEIIDSLVAQLGESKHFYLADTSELPSEKTSQLRRMCFDKQIKMIVVKNTLLRKALERANDAEYNGMYNALKGPISILFSESNSAPAKLIKEFRKDGKKPLLKAAYVEQSVYLGDDQLDALASIKSRDELIGDVIALLQSPARNVISALQGAGGTLSGLVKTLSERPE
jgi:large subunit ribosomal protein L10